MDNLNLEILRIIEMASGNLSLDLTEKISWGTFPMFAEKIIELLKGSIVSKADGPDIRVWDVSINGKKFFLTFDDFPIMVSLEAKDKEGSDEIIKIQNILLPKRGRF